MQPELNVGGERVDATEAPLAARVKPEVVGEQRERVVEEAEARDKRQQRARVRHAEDGAARGRCPIDPLPDRKRRSLFVNMARGSIKDFWDST